MTSLDLESAEARNALVFLKDHHTVVDPTMALFEFFIATTAKPPSSFEPGVNKIAPELAEQLARFATQYRKLPQTGVSSVWSEGDHHVSAIGKPAHRGCQHSVG